MRARVRLARAFNLVLIGALVVFGAVACVSTAPTVIERYLSAVSVPGEAGAQTQLIGDLLGPGSLDGPTIVVGDSATVVNGGSIQQRVESVNAFVAVRIAVEDLESDGGPGLGYWEVTFPQPTTQATIVLSVPQSLPGQSFIVHFAAADAAGRQGERATQTVDSVAVGTGDVQVSVSWDVDSDLDLHVIEPDGTEIFWDQPFSPSGGTLDLDSNAACEIDSVRNENFTWESGTAPPGEYRVLVDLWGSCDVTPTSFVVTVVVAGQVTRTFTGAIDGAGDGGGAGAGQLVASFEVPQFVEGAPAPGPTTERGPSLGTPSAFRDLKTVAEAVLTPLQGVVLLISAALLTVLVGIPGALLTGVVTARWESWFRWARRPVNALRAVAARPQPLWLFAVGVVLATLISAFVDPRFGVNLMSVRLYLTLFIAFGVFNVGVWIAMREVVRRIEPDIPPPTLQLRFGSLGILLVSVVLSRVLSFDPGIVFGLVAGLLFASALVASRRATAVLVGAGFAAAAGLASWLLYSALVAFGGGSPGAFLLGVTETFAAITILGVATLPIALLPFATLDGAELWGWRRLVWALCYLGASALFLLVMVTVPGGVVPVPTDFLRWLALYLVFAAFAVGVWLLHRAAERRGASAERPVSVDVPSDAKSN